MKKMKILYELNEFYRSTYRHLGYQDKIKSSNLSHILGYMATDMVKNIENNIKLNFFKYVRQFANVFFKPIFKRAIENANKKDKVELKKELDKDLNEIKDDLINNTSNCNPKYNKWINKHRSKIFPKDYKHSYEFDIVHYPQKYIRNMIHMCIELEKLGGKSFQFFPLRSNIVPKYIPIDTATIVELFIVKTKTKTKTKNKTKNDYNNNIGEYEDELWEKLLKMDHKIFKQNNYSFDHRILTDGFTVSIQMIKNDAIDKSKKIKANRKDANQIARKEYKDISEKKKIN